MASEIERHWDGPSAGSMTLGCCAVGCGIRCLVKGVEELGQGVMFSVTPNEPYVVLGHGTAVPVLEFCCGSVDQVACFAELALQHVSVGVVGDEH